MSEEKCADFECSNGYSGNAENVSFSVQDIPSVPEPTHHKSILIRIYATVSKYNGSYASFALMESNSCHSVLYNNVLPNNSMLPVKMRRHFEIMHADWKAGCAVEHPKVADCE